jgi:hypothetical protein
VTDDRAASDESAGTDGAASAGHAGHAGQEVNEAHAASAVDVPPETLGRLRTLCLGLPEAHEEQAWVGTRWRIRTRTFAHVLTVDDGWPPAYARAVGSDGPCVVLTFRVSGPELEALSHAGRPFFKPVWFPDIIGMVLDAQTDWGEVAELVTAGYCLLAPKSLAARVDPTPGPPTDRHEHP